MFNYSFSTLHPLLDTSPVTVGIELLLLLLLLKKSDWPTADALALVWRDLLSKLDIKAASGAVFFFER